MGILDSQGNPVRQVTDQQITNAISNLARRSQATEQHLMQLGLLTEFMINKLTSIEINGTRLLEIDETEFETFSNNRLKEIAENVKLMQEQVLKQPVSANNTTQEVDLKE